MEDGSPVAALLSNVGGHDRILHIRRLLRRGRTQWRDRCPLSSRRQRLCAYSIGARRQPSLVPRRLSRSWTTRRTSRCDPELVHLTRALILITRTGFAGACCARRWVSPNRLGHRAAAMDGWRTRRIRLAGVVAQADAARQCCTPAADSTEKHCPSTHRNKERI
ncbi:MAG: hypothetical protein JWP83_5318 [Mycobacterium sp.]|jgi:hypothetical protein|nr:hypothetical protein [Mycobacterium sp.]